MTNGDNSKGSVNRRSFLRLAGASGIVGSSTLLAGCSGGGDGGGGTDTEGGGGGGSTDTPSGSDTETETETATPEPSEITRGGTLTVAMQSDPWTMNAHQNEDTSSSQLSINFGNTLVDVTHEGDLVPDLAKEMPEISDDGTTYTFQIREGVQFHGDYGEITAQTVVDNFHKILDEEYGAPPRADYEGFLVGDNIDPEESVQATGEYEVTLNLAKPYAPILYKLASDNMSLHPIEAIEEHGEDFGNVEVGTWSTGPFQFVEAKADDHYTFERNPDYFKEGKDGEPLPYLDELRFEVAPEASVRKTALQTGDIDVSGRVPARDVEPLKNTDGVKIQSTPGSSEEALYINQRTYEPFTKKKMRQALMYATNHEAVIETKFNGLAEPGWSFVPSWHWAYDDEAVKKYPHNIEKAKQLISEAGEEGLTFNCSPTNQPLFVDVAQILQQNFSQVGLTMEITPKEKSAAWEPTLGGGWDPETNKPKDKVGPPSDYHSHIEDITLGFNADDYFYLLLHTDAWLNVSFYSNEQVDKWMEEARAIPDREQRKELYSKVQEQVTEDTPQINQVWWFVNQGLRENVMGFNIYPSFSMRFESVWKEQ